MSTPPPPPPPADPSPTPPPTGPYYPQQPYYAPGWSAPAPVPPRAPRRGRRVLVAVVAGVVVVALVAGGGAVRFLLERRPLGEVDAPVTAHVGRLQPGHCLATLPHDGDVDRVEVVPCTSTHQAEVLGLLDLPGEPWPGQDAVDARVQSWCEMDTAQREAGFRAVVWTPSELGWAQGDRTGVCLAAAPPGGTVGSFTEGDAAG
ncbi:MAG TPA: septum formation family protein [Actinotalea sp.]|nr:septum formation family protein [Actinotalea sp.]